MRGVLRQSKAQSFLLGWFGVKSSLELCESVDLQAHLLRPQPTVADRVFAGHSLTEVSLVGRIMTEVRLATCILNQL